MVNRLFAKSKKDKSVLMPSFRYKLYNFESRLTVLFTYLPSSWSITLLTATIFPIVRPLVILLADRVLVLIVSEVIFGICKFPSLILHNSSTVCIDSKIAVSVFFMKSLDKYPFKYWELRFLITLVELLIIMVYFH